MQDAAAAGSTVQIRLLDLTHRHCLEKGAGMCKYNFLSIIPQQQNALGSSAIVKVSEQTGAAPKPIPPRFPGSK